MTDSECSSFATYCEEVQLCRRTTWAAPRFYAKLAAGFTPGGILPTDEWNDLLDFVSPDVSLPVCPVTPHH